MGNSNFPPIITSRAKSRGRAIRSFAMQVSDYDSTILYIQGIGRGRTREWFVETHITPSFFVVFSFSTKKRGFTIFCMAAAFAAAFAGLGY